MESYYDARVDVLRSVSAWSQVNGGVQLHFHDCTELVYIRSGQVTAMVDGASQILHAGDILLISGFTHHSLSLSKECVYYVVTIPRNLLPEWNLQLDYQTFSRCFIHDDAAHTLSTLIITLHDIHEYQGMFAKNFFTAEERDMELRLLSAALFKMIVRLSPLVPKKRLTVPVADAVHYINCHYREKLLVSDIAKAVYSNAQQLSEQFRAVMHVSISDYICSLRTAEAARLLIEYPELKLDDVIQRSGFQSTRSLFRAIRDQYGCTPCEMRNKQK